MQSESTLHKFDSVPRWKKLNLKIILRPIITKKDKVERRANIFSFQYPLKDIWGENDKHVDRGYTKEAGYKSDVFHAILHTLNF